MASLWWRFAASGAVPAKWYLGDLPIDRARHQFSDKKKLQLEIVSHCWRYNNLLTYQLSSLATFPPKKTQVTMTVFYAEEDLPTRKLLDFFSEVSVENVRWNWRPLTRQELFRRGIGRNLAARETRADWIWFTDCDLMFQENCLDALAERLSGADDVLVFPAIENTTSLLAEDDPMLAAGAKPQVLHVSSGNFNSHSRDRATGPLQITHGDVARACGYCENIALYQTPSNIWCKAHEDRAFRWLLGTQGKPIEIPGVFRIRHVHKGRYTGSTWKNQLRKFVRTLSAKLKGED